MKALESALVDVRSLNADWLHVFRLRVSGWLPRAAFKEARSQGTLRYVSDELRDKIALTDYGRSLTDPGAGSENETNATLIACSIIARGTGLKDFVPTSESDGAYLAKEDMLPESFRRLVYAALKREEAIAGVQQPS